MHTKCLENFSPPILLSAVVIGLMGGEACVLTSVMRRGKKTSGKCFYSFSLSFKDTEHLLYARLLLKSMERKWGASRCPYTQAAPFLGAMWHAVTEQIHIFKQSYS